MSGTRQAALAVRLPAAEGGATTAAGAHGAGMAFTTVMELPDRHLVDPGARGRPARLPRP